MTDNEIIKALECCTTNGASCKGCPAFVKVDRSNCKKYFRGAIDLINRQKAEIDDLNKDLADTIALNYEERKGLKAEIEDLKMQVKVYEALFLRCYGITICGNNPIAYIKAEAIKEFAERLKGTFPKDDFLRSTKRISEDIDNLVKEMVGDV
jgi:hypothetical protein